MLQNHPQSNRSAVYTILHYIVRHENNSFSWVKSFFSVPPSEQWRRFTQARILFEVYIIILYTYNDSNPIARITIKYFMMIIRIITIWQQMDEKKNDPPWTTSPDRPRTTDVLNFLVIIKTIFFRNDFSNQQTFFKFEITL